MRRVVQLPAPSAQRWQRGSKTIHHWWRLRNVEPIGFLLVFFFFFFNYIDFLFVYLFILSIESMVSKLSILFVLLNKDLNFGRKKKSFFLKQLSVMCVTAFTGRWFHHIMTGFHTLRTQLLCNMLQQINTHLQSFSFTFPHCACPLQQPHLRPNTQRSHTRVIIVN